MAVSVSTGAYRSMKLGEGFIEIVPRIQRGFQRSLTAGLSHVGATLTKAVTLPLVTAGGAAVKMAADYDRSMTRVSALTNASSTEVQKFSRVLLDRAGDWGVAPKDLAEALFLVTSSGETGAEAMQTLEVAAKATAVGLGSTEDIVKLATTAVAAYGRENMSSARAMDILTAAGKESADAADEIGQAMRPAIPIAANLGVSFEETAAAMAALTRTLEPAQAGTSLRQLFVTLQNPTKQAREVLESVGLSAEGLRRELRENGLLSVLSLLTDRFGDNEEASAALFGNIRALTGFLALTNMESNELAEIFDRVENSAGALNEAFEETEKSGAFRIRAALVQLQAALIQVGTVALPIVARGFEGISAVFAKFGDLSDDAQRMFVQFLIFAAAVGPTILIISKLVGGFVVLRHAIQHVAAALALINGLKTVLPALAAALGGPVGVVTALATAFTIAMFASESLRQHVGNLLGILAGVIPVVGNVARAFGSFLAGAIQALLLPLELLFGVLGSLPGPLAAVVAGALALAVALRFGGALSASIIALGAIMVLVKDLGPAFQQLAVAIGVVMVALNKKIGMAGKVVLIFGAVVMAMEALGVESAVAAIDIEKLALSLDDFIRTGELTSEMTTVVGENFNMVSDSLKLAGFEAWLAEDAFGSFLLKITEFGDWMMGFGLNSVFANLAEEIFGVHTSLGQARERLEALDEAMVHWVSTGGDVVVGIRSIQDGLGATNAEMQEHLEHMDGTRELYELQVEALGPLAAALGLNTVEITALTNKMGDLAELNPVYAERVLRSTAATEDFARLADSMGISAEELYEILASQAIPAFEELEEKIKGADSALSQLLDEGNIDSAIDGFFGMYEELTALGMAHDEIMDKFPSFNEALSSYRERLEKVESQLKDNSGATRELREEMEAQHEALLAQIDPMFAFASQLDAVAEAENDLTEAKGEHAAGSREVAAAEDALAQEILKLYGTAVEAYGGVADASADQLKAILEDSGMHKEDIASVMGRMEEYGILATEMADRTYHGDVELETRAAREKLNEYDEELRKVLNGPLHGDRSYSRKDHERAMASGGATDSRTMTIEADTTPAEEALEKLGIEGKENLDGIAAASRAAGDDLQRIVPRADDARKSLEDLSKEWGNLNPRSGGPGGNRHGSASTGRNQTGQGIRRSMGGMVFGPGSETSDSILARLSNGEFVQRASAVALYGEDIMEAINAGEIDANELRDLAGFSKGGLVGRYHIPRFNRGGAAGGGGGINAPFDLTDAGGWRNVEQAINAVVSSIRNLHGALQDLSGLMTTSVQQWINDLNQWRDSWTAHSNEITSGSNRIRSSISGISSTLVSESANWINTGLQFSTRWATEVVSQVIEGNNSIVQSWRTMTSQLLQVWQKFANDSLAATQRFLNQLRETWIRTMNQLSDGWQRVLDRLQNMWRQTLGNLQNSFTSFANHLRARWDDFLRHLGDSFNRFTDDIRHRWQRWFFDLASKWTSFSQHMTREFNSWFSRSRNDMDSFANAMSTRWREMWEEFTRHWNEFRPTVQTEIPQAFDEFRENSIRTFEETAEGIGREWDRIRAFTRDPVRFVIATVYNEALGNLFSAAKSIFEDMPDFSRASLPPGFARGGIYPGYTPGRDIGFAAVSGGEAIMRPEWTRAMGEDYVRNANEVARKYGASGVRAYMGEFFTGGIVGQIRSATAAVRRAASDIDVGDLIQHDSMEAAAKPIESGIDSIPDSGIRHAARRTGVSLWDMLLEQLVTMDVPAIAEGTGGDRGIGSSALLQAMAGFVRSAAPGMTVSSGQRNTPDYHGKSRAIDMIFSDGSQNRNAGQSLIGQAGAAAKAITERFMANTLELIFDPLGNRGIWNGRFHRFTGGSAGPGTHNDHIHWAFGGTEEEIKKGGSASGAGSGGEWGEGGGSYTAGDFGTVEKATGLFAKAKKAQKEAAAALASSGLVEGDGSIMNQAYNQAQAMLKNHPHRRKILEALFMAGFVESNFRSGSSVRNVDHDSAGFLQQRPSMGWGSVSQVEDPRFATRQFVERAMRMPGLAGMSPGNLAQAIQRSAFPGRYAQRAGAARSAISRLGGFFDEGGILAPGTTMATNLTQSPEVVLTQDQWRAVSTAANRPIELDARLYIDGKEIDARIELVNKEKDKEDAMAYLSRRRRG